MNVNGVTSTKGYFTSYNADSSAKVSAEEVAESFEDTGVIYEPTLEFPTKTYLANEEVIARLKADAQTRSDQLQQIVSQLISKQGGVYADAKGIWNFLREGDYTVDSETKAKAEEDISEDGYWGVNQTSGRIIDFAMALTGGDDSALLKMREAFKKGFDDAKETWGGELPDICRKTYDAVLEKFDGLITE